MTLIYQGRQLKLHKRATCLLELLKAAQARQTLFEKDLALWRRGTYDTPIRLMQKEEDILIKIARMNQVQKRILKSYHWLILDLYEITDQFMLPINTFL
jgi:hypothetical protein